MGHYHLVALGQIGQVFPADGLRLKNKPINSKTGWVGANGTGNLKEVLAFVPGLSRPNIGDHERVSRIKGTKKPLKTIDLNSNLGRKTAYLLWANTWKGR